MGVHGLGTPRSSPGLPRPAGGDGRAGRRAGLAPREGARWRGRRGASGPARPGYLGAREGAVPELRPGRAWAVLPLGKFSHYRCQLTKALMSLRLFRPAGKVKGGGVRGRSSPPQSEPFGPQAALFDFQRAAEEASFTC